MQELPDIPWIHIGECPLCVDGLCRIRVCSANGSSHLFAMCDECGSLWTQPSTADEPAFADLDRPVCPVCGQPMHGPQAGWARAEDVRQVPEWDEAAIFDVPSSEVPGVRDAAAQDAAMEDSPEDPNAGP